MLLRELITRLHLTLFPVPLFEALTKKSFRQGDLKEVLGALDKKTKDLFDLFLAHKDTEPFLKNKPKIISELY